MRKRTTIIIVLLFIHFIVPAQHNSSLRSNYFVEAGADLLKGEWGYAYSFRAAVGPSFRRWQLGVGAGWENYSRKSMPLFFSARYFPTTRFPKFFVQGDAGLNLCFLKPGLDRFNNVISDIYRPGPYWSGLFGYAHSIGRKQTLLFTAGYSYKKLVEEKKHPTMCLNPPCAIVTDYYRYNLRRIKVGIGWQFTSSPKKR